MVDDINAGDMGYLVHRHVVIVDGTAFFKGEVGTEACGGTGLPDAVDEFGGMIERETFLIGKRAP